MRSVYTYRENGFNFTPDNLSDTQNIADPIAGLFPNEYEPAASSTSPRSTASS